MLQIDTQSFKLLCIFNPSPFDHPTSIRRSFTTNHQENWSTIFIIIKAVVYVISLKYSYEKWGMSKIIIGKAEVSTSLMKTDIILGRYLNNVIKVFFSPLFNPTSFIYKCPCLGLSTHIRAVRAQDLDRPCTVTGSKIMVCFYMNSFTHTHIWVGNGATVPGPTPWRDIDYIFFKYMDDKFLNISGKHL